MKNVTVNLFVTGSPEETLERVIKLYEIWEEKTDPADELKIYINDKH